MPQETVEPAQPAGQDGLPVATEEKVPLPMQKKAAAIGLAAFGVALLTSGWTGSYLMKRFGRASPVAQAANPATAVSAQAVLKPLPSSMAQQTAAPTASAVASETELIPPAPLFEKMNWQTVREDWHQAKLALKEFEEKQAVAPEGEALNFSPVGDAVRALGIATVINVAIFGSAGWGLAWYYNLGSVRGRGCFPCYSA